MIPNRFALAVLGITCVAAAAGGGYLAARHNAAVEPAAAASTAELAAAPSPAAPAVTETEAVIADSKPVDRPAPSPPVDTRKPVVQERPAAAPPRSAPARPARRAEPPQARNTQAPQSAWPISAPADSTPPQPSPEPPAAQPIVEASAAEAARLPEPPRAPEKVFEELVVSSNSVIGLQLDGAISSDRATVEDRVEARVVRDVRVGNDVAIPAGARALGSVMLVERGGKFKERSRLGIRFHTLVLADGTRLPITSETIFRSGDAPGNSSAAKIGGGAVAGAILGAIIGGAKGAAVGATAGAGGGTAAVMASDPKAATFPSGTEVTARILSPVAITVER